jgi:hypothetical protein
MKFPQIWQSENKKEKKKKKGLEKQIQFGPNQCTPYYQNSASDFVH